MNAREILLRAKSLRDCKYWYGGKRELASKALADRLKNENPSVWTTGYYSKALKDVDGKTHVCDCSGLVCYAYGTSDIGSYAIKEKYKEWTGEPKAGMIGWKRGHVGIFSADGWGAPIIEMRGIDYDYMCSRTFKECGFTAVLHGVGVDYDASSDDNTAIGWHSDDVGWWYRFAVGYGPSTYYHDCFKEVGGHLYLFDGMGYICTNPVWSKHNDDYNLTEMTFEIVPPTSGTGWIR